MTTEEQLKLAHAEREEWRERAQQNRKLLILAVEALVSAHEALEEERADLARAIKEIRGG